MQNSLKRLLTDKTEPSSKKAKSNQAQPDNITELEQLAKQALIMAQKLNEVAAVSIAHHPVLSSKFKDLYQELSKEIAENKKDIWNATSSVLQMPAELLEEVLLNLSSREIAMAGATCRFFRSASLAVGKRYYNYPLAETKSFITDYKDKFKYESALLPDNRLVLITPFLHSSIGLAIWDLSEGLRIHTLPVQTNFSLPPRQYPDIPMRYTNFTPLYMAHTPFAPGFLPIGNSIIRRSPDVPFIKTTALSRGRLLSISPDQNIQLWDLTTGECRFTIKNRDQSSYRDLLGHDIDYCIELPNNQFASSSSKDNTIKIWDLASGRFLHMLMDSGEMYSLPNGHLLVVSPYLVRVWEIASGKCKTQLIADKVIPLANGHISLVIASNIEIVDPMTGQIIQTLRSEENLPTDQYFIQQCELLANDKLISVGIVADGSIIALWDLTTGKCQQVIKEDGKVEFMPNGWVVILDAQVENTWLWNPVTGDYRKKQEFFTRVRAMPNGHLVGITGESYNIIKIWEPITDQTLASFKVQYKIIDMVVDSVGNITVWGRADQTCEHMQSGECNVTLFKFASIPQYSLPAPVQSRDVNKPNSLSI